MMLFFVRLHVLRWWFYKVVGFKVGGFVGGCFVECDFPCCSFKAFAF